jgi:cytochrome c-type biogenesis protein CcmH/NrfG
MRALDRGLALAEKGRWTEAISAYETALGERPNDPAILFALGRAALALGSLDAAIGFFARVLAYDPDRIEAIVKLAEAYASATRHADAIELLQSTLPRRPEEPVLWLTLGNIVRELNDLSNAETFFREALRLKPKSAEAMGNLADLLFDRGEIEEADALYERALKIAPQNAQLHLNRALLLLHQGNLEEGWRAYEWRLRIPSRAIERNHGLKRWAGKPRNGASLLVCAEQGLGDQILFASCLSDAAKDGHLIIECEPRLVPLFARSFRAATVQTQDARREGTHHVMDYAWLKSLPRPDSFIELASLPFYLRSSSDNFPSPNSYLRADPNQKDEWTKWAASLGEKPKIGLCWRSGKTGGLRSAQYAPLEAWAKFAQSLTATFICTQYDARTEEIEALQSKAGIKLHIPPGVDQKNDIDRTAALISSLDVVVSAPTAVASLSGALGVPTLKLLFDKSWTSFGRDYEPMMPSCKCLKPSRAGDWADVFAHAQRLIVENTQFCHSRGGGKVDSRLKCNR